MEQPPHKLGSSADEQVLLRAAALWAVEYAERVLVIFEDRHPEDRRVRAALEAGRAFGQGRARDKNLRIVAMDALRAARGVDEASKYAAQAAMLTAAVAYTHTDLTVGVQGERQAKHVLGPVVYAALAMEAAAGGSVVAGGELMKEAAASAPPEVHRLIVHMPPQPKSPGRLGELFSELDSALRPTE